MDIIQVVGLGIVSTLIILVLKEHKPVFGMLLAVFVGVVIFLTLAEKLAGIFQMLTDLAQKARINNLFLVTILKIIGVAYIAEFGAQVAKDAGQGSIAAKIELAGKVLIIVMAVPIIVTIIELVIQLLPPQGWK